MDLRERAIEHLEKVEDGEAWTQIGIAGVYAVLHVADTIGHGLRDIIYELRS